MNKNGIDIVALFWVIIMSACIGINISDASLHTPAFWGNIAATVICSVALILNTIRLLKSL